MMHAVVLAVAAWGIALPLVIAVGIKGDPVAKVSFRGDNDPPIKFRLQNSQIPFYNNVLGYALDLKGDNLYLTSGVFQSAWRCQMSGAPSDKIVTTTGAGQCTRLKDTKAWGNFHKARADIDVSSTVSVEALNRQIKGTAASWNYESFDYGFGWGRSISVAKNNRVAVGCPGCTGASLPLPTNPTPADAKRLSGLVFEYANSNADPQVIDTSYSSDQFYGGENEFDFVRSDGDFANNYKNTDFNCGNAKSGCNLGTSVKYRGNNLFATRGRSTRDLARAQGFLKNLECATDFGTKKGGAYCQMLSSAHFAVGDALDVTTADRATSPTSSNEHGTEKTTVYNIKGWGYSDQKVSGGNVFGRMTTPAQTPYHSRFGQATETGWLLRDPTTNEVNNLNNLDMAFGAPGYGSYGAVFVYGAFQDTLPRKNTGLRIDSKVQTFEINGPSTGTVQTNFGYSLRAFVVDEATTKRSHLAVGAPTYTTDDYRGGAVFTYKGANLKFTLQNVLRPKRNEISVSARFGSAITSIDLDDDVVHEIIVGAPFNQVGCEALPGKSYCGALFVFSGSKLNGNGEIVFPSQTVVGKEIYGMLGHALVANTQFVFASAPGVFGENGIFANSLTKALDTLQLDWPVNPQVQQFGSLRVVSFTTEYREASTSTSETIADAGGLLTVPIGAFDDSGESFEFTFDVQKNGVNDGGEFTVEYPDIYRDDRYTVEVFKGGVLTTDYTFAAGNAGEVVKIKVTRKSGISDSDIDQEAAKLEEDVVFAVTQKVNEDVDVAREGSSVRASVSVRVADTSESILEVAVEVQDPQDRKLRIGGGVNSSITVTNSRNTADSLVTLSVELKNVERSNVVDFLTFRKVQIQQKSQDVPTWPTSSLTGNVSGAFPVAMFKKRLPKIKSGESVVVDLDFILKDVFQTTFNNYADVEITAIVDGTGFQARSDSVTLTVDDTCTVNVTGSLQLPQGLDTVIQGGIFTLAHNIAPQPGKEFKPHLETDLGYAIDIFKLGENCVTENYCGLLCNETINANGVKQPTTFKRDDLFVLNGTINGPVCSNDTLPQGCFAMPSLTLTCCGKDSDCQAVGFEDDEVKFENVLTVRDNLFGIVGLRTEAYTLTTRYSGETCEYSAPFAPRFTIASGKFLSVAGTDGVAWWVILLAVLGALLLAAIVGLVLWKVGFFKRTKPPTDGMDNSGQLDQEVAGGSVLRG